jgi:F-type H+-transporting ATPase subunit delta
MYNSHKYAKTLLNVSVKANIVLTVKKELQMVAYLFKKTSTFRLIFITKKIDLNKKSEIIHNALNMLSPLTLEFLTIIINNNHSNDLLNIISKFNHLSEHHLGVNNVDIITATKLSDEELNSLSQKIDGILNNSPSVNNITDPNIIGGMKLRVGNNIFDNSVSYQINQLKKTLHNM